MNEGLQVVAMLVKRRQEEECCCLNERRRGIQTKEAKKLERNVAVVEKRQKYGKRIDGRV